MRHNSKALFLVLFLPLLVWGQASLTLNEAFKLAMEKNPDIIAARNLAAVNHNNSSPGNAGLLPKVDVKASSLFSDGDTQTPSGGYMQAQSTRNALSVEASYTLFDGFANINNWKKLQSVSDYYRIISRQTIENTLMTVARSYYSVALNEDRVEIAKQSLDISKERWKRARNRIQYGQGNTIEVLNAEVDYYTDSISMLNARLALEQARRDFNILFNRNPDMPFRVNHEITFSPLPEPDSLLHLAMSANAAFLAVKELTRQAQKDEHIAASGFLPRLNAVASYSANKTLNNYKIGLSDPYTDATVSLNLSLNLFNGMQDKIRVQNARILRKTQLLREEETRHRLQSSVKNAWQAYENSQVVFETSKKSLETARLNFQRSRELYNLGQITSTRFREAQLNLINARIHVFQSTYDAKLAELQLLQLAGILLQSI